MKKLFLTILSLLFIGCGGGSSPSSQIIEEENNNTVEIIYQTIEEVDENFTLIERGYVSVDRNFSKKLQVISSQLEFNKILKTTQNSVNIDFSKNSILAFVLGDKPSNQYSINVNNIKRVKNKREYIKVLLETTIIKDECIKNKEHVLPFIFVSTPIKPYEQFIFEESIKVVECGESDLNETPQIVTFKKIENDTIEYNSGLKFKSIKIIKDRETLNELYLDDLSDRIDLSDIDFENETLIALSMGEKDSHGYYINVIEVNEYNEYIEVKVENNYPWSLSISQPLMTYPASFITIPKTEKEIIFKEYVNIY